MSCTREKLKTLRDEHGFSPAKLKAAKKYIQGKEYWDNNNEITNSVINDTGKYLRTTYGKTDKELRILNESAPRVGNAPVTVHGVTEDVAIITYPNSTDGYTYPINDVKIAGKGAKEFLSTEVDKESDARRLVEEADAEFLRSTYEAEGLSTKYLNSEANEQVDQGEVVLDGKNINSYAAITELAKALEAKDNIGTSDAHSEQLGKVVKMLLSGSSKPMREMNVYLNDKGRDNGGTIRVTGEHAILLNKGTRSKTFGTDMSLVEKFVHELTHGSGHFGLNHRPAEVARQIDQLKKLRMELMKVLTVDDMVDGSIMTQDGKAEREIAQERIDYMNGSLEEFLAYALTHEPVIKKLRTINIKPLKKDKKYEGLPGAMEYILDLMKDILDIAYKSWTGKDVRRSMRGDVLAMQLMSDFAKVNQDVKAAENAGLWGSLQNKIDDWEVTSVKWLDGIEAKGNKKIKAMIESRDKKSIVDLMKIVWYAVSQDEGTPLLQGFLTHVLGQRPEGFFQTMLRHLKKADDYGNTLQDLTMAAGTIDGKQMQISTGLTAVVSKVFKKRLNKRAKKAIYTSMETVAGYHLVTEYGENATKLYTDSAELESKITGLEQVVGNETEITTDYNSVISQAKGLANYMATGIPSIVQRRNAEEIVRYSTGVENAKLVKAVDTLASLYAIRDMNPTVKEETAKVLESEYKAIANVAKLRIGFMEAKKAKMTEMQIRNMAKNYHREAYDGIIAMKVGKKSDKRKMADDGFEIVKEIPNNGLGVDYEQLVLYTSKTNTREAFNRSSWRYLGEDSNGRLLKDDLMTAGMTATLGTDIWTQLKNGAKEASKYEKAVREGKTPEITTSVIPEVNEHGEVVDYRATVSTEDKVKYLGLETDPIGTIGRNWAHEYDKEATIKHNKIVEDEMMRDMVENVDAANTLGIRNKLDYIELSKDSGIFEVKDAARILPKAMQDKLYKLKVGAEALALAKALEKEGKSYDAVMKGIKDMKGAKDVEYKDNGTGKMFYQLNDAAIVEVVGQKHWDNASTSRKGHVRRRLGKGHVMVRRDMILDMFGIRDLSAAEWVNGKFIGKTNAKQLKKAVKQIEAVWKEIVSIFKVDMIIRMLPVLTGNIMSNIMYSIQYGHNPLAIARRQLDGIVALKDYLKSQKELTEIVAQLSMDPENRALKAAHAKAMSDMDENPAKPLLDAGLYQHIVEDIGAGDLKSSNKLTRKIDDKMEGTPQLVKDGVNWLFINEKTSLFQMVTKATAYSDFVARYAQFTLTKEKEMMKFERRNNRKMSGAELDAMTNTLTVAVRDAFVNYSKPDSRLMQYANDMGFVAFTKYKIRIQKAIGDLVRGRPLRFALAVIGQELFTTGTGYDPDDFLEASFTTNTPDSWFYTPGVETIITNIIEPQMISHIKNVMD